MRNVQGLIRHGRILTLDQTDRIIEDGAIAFDAGRVLAVGTTAQIDAAYSSTQSCDAQGAIVRPGFIDAHIHVSQYTARSALPRLAGGRLNMGHWKSEIRPEDEAASARLAALDYLACGYTGFVDPGTIFEPDAVAPVADEIGIRLWLTDPYVADRGHQLGDKSPELVSGSFLARWPKSLDEAAARIGRQLGRNATEGLARAFIGIYGEGTDTAELRAHAIGTARREGVQFQMHLGYTPSGYRAQSEAARRTTLQAIADAQGLDAGQTFTHLNLVEPADEALLATSKPAVIWCPYGTLQMMGEGAALSRMVPLACAGVPVALATDIPRAVEFDAIAGLAVGCSAASGTPITPSDLLAMRTRQAAASVGAAALCGRIAAGLSADIVVEKAGELDVSPIWEAAVLSGRRTVRHVFVAGRQVLADGGFVDADVAAIRRRAQESALGIMARIGL